MTKEKRSKPAKRYTEEEQLARRQEDCAAITGKSDLAGISEAIHESAEQAEEQRTEWQRLIGEPDQVYEVEGYKYGFWKYGFWNVPEGVLVVRIDKRGPNPATQQIFTTEFIEKLNKAQGERE